MSGLIEITLPAQELQMEPGQEGQLPVTVGNLSEIVDQYVLEVEGLDPTWFALSTASISLFPQDRGQAAILLHPPQDARAGQYQLSVKATSRENSLVWNRVEALLNIVPVFGFELGLSPRRGSTIGQQATFTVRLTNSGNADLTLELSATDPEEGCDYVFQPHRATVAAGESSTVPLAVIPKEARRQQAARYEFAVRAAPEDAEHQPKTVLGQLEYRPPAIPLELAVPLERAASSISIAVWGGAGFASGALVMSLLGLSGTPLGTAILGVIGCLGIGLGLKRHILALLLVGALGFPVSFLLALAMLPLRAAGAMPSAAMWGAIACLAVGLALGYHREAVILVPVGALAMVVASYLSLVLASLGALGWALTGGAFGLLLGFTVDLIERQTVRRQPSVAGGGL